MTNFAIAVLVTVVCLQLGSRTGDAAVVKLTAPDLFDELFADQDEKCEDKLPDCAMSIAANSNYCRYSREIKNDLCKESCGRCATPRTVAGSHEEESIDSDEAVEDSLLPDFLLDEGKKCADAEPSACPDRFNFTTCQKNYKTMLKKCRKTCHLCEVVKPPSPSAKCADAKPTSCPKKFNFDFCQKNYYEMLIKCRKTCHLCEVAKLPAPSVQCKDTEPFVCPKKFDFNYCQVHYYEMLLKCRKTCHLCEVYDV